MEAGDLGEDNDVSEESEGRDGVFRRHLPTSIIHPQHQTKRRLITCQGRAWMDTAAGVAMWAEPSSTMLSS